MYIASMYIATSLCFNAAVLPIQMLRHRQPKDHISTAVVYSVSYGPDRVMCMETYNIKIVSRVNL